MLEALLSPGAWALRHFSEVDLKDKRLNRRAVKLAEAMAAHPSASIPDQCGSWGDTKAAYRFFADPGVTFQRISESHWHQTRQEARQCGRSEEDPQDVLFIQDSSWLSFGHHPATEGLGRHGRGQSCGDRGLHLHSVLAVQPRVDQASPSTDQAAVLGLAYGQLWARPAELYHADAAARSRRRRSADRESLRWGQAVQQVGSAPPGCRYLHVGDREADLFDLYQQTRQLERVGFVVRGKHDRNALPGHDTPEVIGRKQITGSRLKPLIRSVPPQLGMTLQIAANNGRIARQARLQVSYAPVTLYAPQVKGRNQQALRCWCVRVWEPDPPPGVTPIEWILLSSQPVDTLADALRIVRYYHWRWLIEEYHRCLKSGCRVEQRQLTSGQALAGLIGMLCIVATRLLQLKNDTRLHPDAPAQDHAPPQMVRMLCRLTRQDPQTLSLQQFTVGVARQGGFLGRKRDGQPGWQTLWRGWQKLSLLCEGYQMAQAERDVGKG